MKTLAWLLGAGMLLVNFVIYVSVVAVFASAARPVVGVILATAWMAQLMAFSLEGDWDKHFFTTACAFWGFFIPTVTVFLLVLVVLSPVVAPVAVGLGLVLSVRALNNWLALFSTVVALIYLLTAALVVRVRDMK